MRTPNTFSRQEDRNFEVFLCVFFLVIFTRGLVQVAIPKTLAFLFQVAGLGFVSLYFLSLGKFVMDFQRKVLFALTLLFLLCVNISAFITFYSQDEIKWGIYFMFTLLFLVQFWGSLQLYFAKITTKHLPLFVLVAGWTLLFVATLEQLQLIKMPGSSSLVAFVRPASLTGSMLHYPIVMALFAGICFSFYAHSKNKIFLFSACVFSIGLLLVFSRSGIGVLGIFFAFWLFFYLFTSFAAFLRFSLVLGCLIVLFSSALGLILHLDPYERTFMGQVAARVVSFTDTKSKGNSMRLKIWKEVKEEFQTTNMFFGQQMGEYTNTTAFLRPTGLGKVAESSFLQQMMNFGLLGALAFYLMFALPISFFSKEHYVMRALYVAGLAQTFFVQSIEMVAYISLFLLLPWISQNQPEKDYRIW